ncbi:hypothetical protein GCM10011579_019160 [Streptomyces albiflavescens]|uniref:Uncharacterized protein n=1 Tax=Streptomyces albiflavescens TaxID=1623582 RepID=A0A918D171_9ACTN|nr:hypothetical protein [Streptomyces albiflavescens]GGN57188.1 hypothetical protein GCM10011579_019160 [Streptomyces albiflavescens]
MNRRAALSGALEVLAWWAALMALWLVLISAPATLELVVGAAAALVGALAAGGARRAVSGR